MKFFAAQRKIRITGRRAAFLLFSLCLLFGLTAAGCGSAQTDPDTSPVLTDISSDSYNEGSMDSQYVSVVLTFDRAIAVTDDPLENMNITIGGEHMDDVTAEQTGENTLELTILVNAITKSNVCIEETKDGGGYPGITDETGSARAQTFEAEILVPNGVTVEPLASYEGTGVAVLVSGTWSIRSITWLRLLSDGEPVESSETADLELYGDGAIALHGHDFLTSDTTMIASDMAETLNTHFGDYYVFYSEGEEVYGEKLDGTDPSELTLEVYSYKHIEQVTEDE